MRIADILRSKGSSVATVSPMATLADLIGELARHNVGALPVVDEAGRLVGIVSERDVVRQLHAHGPDVFNAAIAEFMTSGVTTCSPSDKVTDLARVMTAGRFRHLPVVIDGRGWSEGLFWEVHQGVVGGLDDRPVRAQPGQHGRGEEARRPHLAQVEGLVSGPDRAVERGQRDVGLA